MKGMVRFGKKWKLSSRYKGPYEILIGSVYYELKLPNDLAFVNRVLHVSMLKKCLGDATSILSVEGLEVAENLSYKEVPVEIFDRQV